jgi:hypothetical protein
MKLTLTKDFRDFVALLNELEVRYVLVGGYAVAWHGYPRFTKDIDFFVERSRENAERLLEVLNRFGLGSLGFTLDDLLAENTGLYFGFPPTRIDLINFADGLSFEEAWASRETGEIEQMPFYVLSRATLIKNKRASGRAQDLADVEKLEERS